MKLRLNVNIINKKNSLKDLFNETKSRGYNNPLIICDKYFITNTYLTDNLKNFKNIKFIEFNKEPTYEMLNYEIKKIRKLKKIDCVIGIGGGSSIDFAKGIATLIKNKGPSTKLMGFPKNINTPLPVIAVPTTTSTGSEVVYNAVFTHEKKKKKLGINSEFNYPVLSLLDTRLIDKTPKNILYQSALAVLVRSIETYTAPDANYITKHFSKISFEMIVSALKSKSKNQNFFQKLQWGCIFSMLSLSNNSGGPSALLHYYLSVNYNISQPLGYSFTAFEFFRENIKKGYKGYDELTYILNNRNKKKNNFFLF